MALLLASLSAHAQTRDGVLLTMEPDESLRRAVALYLNDLVELVTDAEKKPRFHLTLEKTADELVATLESTRRHGEVRSAWATEMSSAELRAFGLKLRSLVRVALLEGDQPVTVIAAPTVPPATTTGWSLELGGGPQVTSSATAAGQVMLGFRGARSTWSVGVELALSVARPARISTGTTQAFVTEPRVSLRWAPLKTADAQWVGFAGLEAGLSIVSISATLQQTQARAFDTQLAPMVGANVGVARALFSWLSLALSPSVEVYPLDQAYTVATVPAFQLGPVRGRIDLRAVFSLWP